MQKQKLIFISLSLLSISLVILYAWFSRRQNDVFSPIPDQTHANVLGITPTITPLATPNPTPTSTPAPKIPKPTPIIIVPTSLEILFTKYNQDYAIDKGFLVQIAYCESRFDPSANNGKYAGLFQFSETLWTQTRSLMGQSQDLSLRFDAEEAIKTAAFMLSQNHPEIWPNCAN